MMVDLLLWLWKSDLLIDEIDENDEEKTEEEERENERKIPSWEWVRR